MCNMDPRVEIIMASWEVLTMSEEESSSDEEILSVVSANSRGQKPVRIVNYLFHSIPNFTAEQFRMHFRMTVSTFDKVLGAVGPSLKNIHSDGRHTVEPKKQLLSVIWLLATPDSFRSVNERFDLAKSTLFNCFFRVIHVLNMIAPTIIKWPSGPYAAEVKEGFSRTGLDSCLGIVDGSYITIKAPRTHPEVYVCRKKFHAITLQAICDHTLKFTDCFAGYPASVNDYRIFKNSDIYKSLIENPLQYFPNNEYIIGDKAYPAKQWCISPYINRGDLCQVQINFNTQLSRVRQCIERSFALLKGRFRRLKYLDMNRIDLIPATILACCVLHNICISDEDVSKEMIEEGQLNNLNDDSISLQSEEMVEMVENGTDEAGTMRRDVIARNLFLQTQ
ncbi:protein ALP1-like [Coccinella septempunctata]|uniref:protein ALP1-like n=1 Tax=Coccinella septempunctata TaxID=41139 RepID=UPI001D05E9B8|nr:protein ALP1-like [Coccinella septempunctata]